ncbi:MAG: amidohydrolase [Clostridiales bacterium]|nr:amidohydrolase [Clostridiales bacterium]
MLKFYNGNIITLDPENPVASSMIIKDGKFLSASNSEIDDNISSDIISYDLMGKTVLPGFNDSHMHLLGLGMALNQLDLSGYRSLNEIRTAIGNYSNENTFIYGRGWNQDYIKEKRMLTREELDEIVPDKPVILLRVCGHILIANTKAMALANSYNQSGLFRENEMAKIKSILPELNKKLIEKYIVDACNELLRYGVTAVQTDDLSAVNEKYFPLVIEVFKSLSKGNKLPIRVYEQSNYGLYDNFMASIPHYVMDPPSDDFFRNGPIKILGDGSLGAHTAKLSKPYYDNPDANGILNFTQEQLDKMINLSHEHHIDVAIHAIGDEMLNMVLNSFRPLNKDNMRHSIIHCQVTSESLLKDIENQGLLLHIQPVFLDYDMHIAENRLGPERSKFSYNYKTLESLGNVVAFGTDSPVEPVNPFYGIYSAVTRKDRNNFPDGGWHPDEKISLTNAIKHYTVDSAYASYDENRKGKIKEGHYADFIVLDQNPYNIEEDMLLNVTVSKTYVHGILRYKK